MVRTITITILLFNIVFSGYTQQNANAIKLGNKFALKAEKHLKKNDFEEALIDFDQAIKADPNNENHYRRRGITHECLANTAAALIDYTEGITLNPETSLLLP